MRKQGFSRVICLALALFLTLGVLPVKAAAGDEAVDVFKENADGTEKYVTVQLAASGSLSNCTTCAKNLRKAGYNAFLYQEASGTRYRIMVGAFSGRDEAGKLQEEIANGPDIKGFDVKRAYLTNVKLTAEAAKHYANYVYDGQSGVNPTPAPTAAPVWGAPTGNAPTDGAVDVFDEENCDTRVVAVQVAATGSLEEAKRDVVRLREAGYNGYVYHAKGAGNYRVVTGVFKNAVEGEKFATYMQNGPTVPGVKVAKAYATNVVITAAGKETYAEKFFNGGPVLLSPGGSSSTPAGGGDEEDVVVVREEWGLYKGTAVQVASSGSESNCKTCILRLRERGYNAYIYKPQNRDSYRILIGFFENKEDAASLLEEIRSGEEVKGVRMSHAFTVNAWLDEGDRANYSDHIW